MLILHLSWEYPPLVYGGLGRHIHALAEEQARQGHEVVVLTQTEGEPEAGTHNGVTVVRTPRDVPIVPFDAGHLLGWVAGLEHSLTRSLARLSGRFEPEVVHAHDWMVAHTAVTSQVLVDRPLVTTFHATEAGRHQGWLTDDLSVSIHTVEWWLAQHSTRVISCSTHMKWEIEKLFEVDAARVDVVPNGIDTRAWQADPDAAAPPEPESPWDTEDATGAEPAGAPDSTDAAGEEDPTAADPGADTTDETAAAPQTEETDT